MSIPGQSLNYGWHNGKIIPENEISIPFLDLGLQYGYGLFETIRAQNGKPMLLEAHLERLAKSWSSLFSFPFPDLPWNEIITRIITENELENGVGRVKITATAGSASPLLDDRNIIITADRYLHRLAGKGKQGFDLAIYPNPRQSMLADHKTLNYLYYHLARNWALQQGADECLILNPDATVSETNSGNLLLIKGKTVILPDSENCLVGIMLKASINYLIKSGFQVKSHKVKITELKDYDEIIVTNSLIGAVPVLSIASEKVGKVPTIFKKINEQFNIEWLS